MAGVGGTGLVLLAQHHSLPFFYTQGEGTKDLSNQD